MLLLYDAPEQINRPAAPALDLVKAVQPRGKIVDKERTRRLDGERGILFRSALYELDSALPRHLRVIEVKDQRQEEFRDLEVSGGCLRKKSKEEAETEVSF